MYNLNKMQRDFVNSLASSGRSRNNQLSMAIAKAVADKQNMPSAPVDDLDTYYTSNVMLPASIVIAKINEVVIIDTANVERYARLFFKARYRMLHPAGYILNSADGSNVKMNFLGIGSILTHDMMSCLKEDFNRVVEVYNGMSSLIVDLQFTDR
jgi:hypothetical protein